MRLQAAFTRALDAEPAGASASEPTLAVVLQAREWGRWLPQAFELLDEAERERVRRRRREGDRDIATLAYACHRLLLARLLDCAPGAVPLRRDALGCPRLAGVPAHTSLSHAEGLVALAVSRAGPVGVDVEPLSRAGAMDEIAARVAHPLELAAVDELSPAPRRRALLSLWVGKEALLKAAGIGMAEEMDGFLAPTGVPLPLPGGVPGSAVVTVFEGEGFLAAVAAPPGGLAIARPGTPAAPH